MGQANPKRSNHFHLPVNSLRFLIELRFSIPTQSYLEDTKQMSSQKPNTPNIDVVITTFNRPQKLDRCLDAVLKQVTPPSNIIIVNDGSHQDYTSVKTRTQALSYVTWIDQDNAGVSAARNTGIEASNAEYVCLCDDDDYFLPHHIDVISKSIASTSDPHIHFTQAKQLSGHIIEDTPFTIKSNEINWQEFLVTAGQMVICCTCMPRAAFLKFPFPTSIKYAEDHEQRLLALSEYPAIQIPQYTSVIDRTDETATNRSVFEISEIYRARFRSIFSHPPIKSNIRRRYQEDQLFRWTTLEIAEMRKTNLLKALFHATISIPRIRTLQNIKSLASQLIAIVIQASFPSREHRKKH